jgi:hypothetical protein
VAQRPSEIREEIKEDREALAETVRALAEKTDVKRQAARSAARARQSANQFVAWLALDPLPAVASLALVLVVTASFRGIRRRGRRAAR